MDDISTSNSPTDSSCKSSNDGKGNSVKTKFSGSCCLIISLLGFSMGTSDFWRFPYLVYRNGGGAFVIPFSLTMLICGVSLMFLELSMSQFSGKGPVNIWQMSPFFKGIGFALININIINNIHYNILRAWIMEYLTGSFKSDVPWGSCNNTWNRPGCVVIGQSVDVINSTGVNYTITNSSITKMTSAEQFFQYEVLKVSSGLEDLGGMLWNQVGYVFGWRLLVVLCMIKGIKSIEKVMFVTVFLPISLMVVLWVRSFSLDGSAQGMLYYLTPRFSRITNIEVWLEAAMMACYTLGPAYGSVLLIGSHNKFSSNCLRHAVVTTVLDCLSAVINGLICFSFLGVMALDSGLGIDNVVTSGMALGFTVYPTAFTFFPFPQVWSALFFINIMLVGLDSQILSMETLMCGLEEVFPAAFKGRRRPVLVVVLNFVAFLCTLPFCTNGGCYVFQLVDWYALAWTLLFVSLAECIVFMWIYGGDRINRDLKIMLGRSLPGLLRISGAFLTPVILVLLLVMSFVRYRPPKYGSYEYPPYALVIGWSLAIGIVAPIAITPPWKLLTAKGTWKERLSSITTPAKDWGPADPTEAVAYKQQPTCIPARTFRSLLLANLTGREPVPRYTAEYQVKNSEPETYKLRDQDSYIISD